MKSVMVNPYKEANKRVIKSRRLKRWLSVVKKHGGDMTKAAKEWKRLKATSAVPRQGAKGRVPEPARGKLIAGLARRAAKELAKEAKPMAGKKKGRKKKKAKKKGKKVAMTAAWKGAWKAGVKAASRAGVGAAAWRRPWAAGVAAANPFTAGQWRKAFTGATGFRPKVKGPAPGTPAWYAALSAGASKAGPAKFQRSLAGRKKPKKARAGSGKAWIAGVKKAARAAGASAGRRAAMNPGNPAFVENMRTALNARMNTAAANAVALNEAPLTASLMALLSVDALKNYGYVGAGFVAGGVVPSVIVKLLQKYDVMGAAPGVIVGTLLGLVSSLGAGVATGAVTGDAEKAQKVAAGGVAGIVGNLILVHLMPALGLAGLSGLGQDAEAIVERAVEQELAKELRGTGGIAGDMGEFVTEEIVEQELGQFMTAPEIEEAPTVADLGTEAEMDIDEAAEGFGYME